VRGGHRAVTGAALALACAAVVGSARGDAHTPVLSPYTYSQHVLPILQAHCGQCHRPGGVGPMSLLTHAEAVPWAESIRVELIAGHMPPWPVEAPRGRFQHAQVLSGKDMNVLLTWASGGTPPGPGDAPPAALPPQEWPLGRPDQEIALPSFTLDERTIDATNSVTLTVPTAVPTAVPTSTVPSGGAAERWLRAVDFRAGVASIVRGATVTIDARDTRAGTDGSAVERTLAVWLPGDAPSPFPAGTAIRLPADARLTVTVRYKKTWSIERLAFDDRSALALYFAEGPATELRALTLAPGRGAAPSDTSTPLSFGADMATASRVVAVYPDQRMTGVRATVDALRPDGTRTELLALGPQGGWPRRYWFSEPVILPRGTRIVVRAQRDDTTFVPAGSRPTLAPLDPASIGLTLNLVPN
jgi:hypothetical protein